MLECYKQAPRNMMNWTVHCHLAVDLVIINIISLYMSPWRPPSTALAHEELK